MSGIVVESECGESNDGSRGSIMKDLEHPIKVLCFLLWMMGARKVFK